MNFLNDFDRIISRRDSGSVKWDRFPHLDPYWIADMDFASPPAVLETLQKRIEFGVMGYAQPHQGLIDVLLDYMQHRHNTTIKEEEIVHLGGLVSALSLVGRAIGKPGDAIMTCTPNYPPFLEVNQDAHMESITVPHIFNNDRWEFDWEAMESAVTPKTKVFLFSNPQNPLGRVFTREEVIKLAEFCERHDLILVSDEIHCDLIYDETSTPHVCGASLPEHFQKRIISLLAPSKTYNIAGLGYSFAIIKDEELRKKFNDAIGHTLPGINCLAFYAAETAYRDGESWRQDLLTYLQTNRDTLVNFIGEHLPLCKVRKNEATYLAWIDCTALNLGNPAKVIEEKLGLYLSDGAFFGAPGHVRFNFGCPHSRMLKGLEKLATLIS